MRGQKSWPSVPAKVLTIFCEKFKVCIMNHAGGNGMKFVYVDETGSDDHTDVFVMTGLLIDAYVLRKYTASFDKMLTAFLAKHPGSPKELKTKVACTRFG